MQVHISFLNALIFFHDHILGYIFKLIHAVDNKGINFYQERRIIDAVHVYFWFFTIQHSRFEFMFNFYISQHLPIYRGKKISYPNQISLECVLLLRMRWASFYMLASNEIIVCLRQKYSFRKAVERCRSQHSHIFHWFKSSINLHVLMSIM